jgi:hypothetical protein
MSGLDVNRPLQTTKADATVGESGHVPLRLGCQMPQFAEPGFVSPPPFDGRAIDGLTRLPETRRLDRAPVEMRSQARLVPIEEAGGNESSCVRLRIGDQGLIVHLDKPILGQHSASVSARAGA